MSKDVKQLLLRVDEKSITFIDKQVELNGFRNRSDYIEYILKMVKENKISFARTINGLEKLKRAD